VRNADFGMRTEENINFAFNTPHSAFKNRSELRSEGQEPSVSDWMIEAGLEAIDDPDNLPGGRKFTDLTIFELIRFLESPYQDVVNAALERLKMTDSEDGKQAVERLLTNLRQQLNELIQRKNDWIKKNVAINDEGLGSATLGELHTHMQPGEETAINNEYLNIQHDILEMYARVNKILDQIYSNRKRLETPESLPPPVDRVRKFMSPTHAPFSPDPVFDFQKSVVSSWAKGQYQSPAWEDLEQIGPYYYDKVKDFEIGTANGRFTSELLIRQFTKFRHRQTGKVYFGGIYDANSAFTMIAGYLFFNLLGLPVRETHILRDLNGKLIILREFIENGTLFNRFPIKYGRDTQFSEDWQKVLRGTLLVDQIIGYTDRDDSNLFALVMQNGEQIPLFVDMKFSLGIPKEAVAGSAGAYTPQYDFSKYVTHLQNGKLHPDFAYNAYYQAATHEDLAWMARRLTPVAPEHLQKIIQMTDQLVSGHSFDLQKLQAEWEKSLAKAKTLYLETGGNRLDNTSKEQTDDTARAEPSAQPELRTVSPEALEGLQAEPLQHDSISETTAKSELRAKVTNKTKEIKRETDLSRRAIIKYGLGLIVGGSLIAGAIYVVRRSLKQDKSLMNEIQLSRADLPNVQNAIQKTIEWLIAKGYPDVDILKHFSELVKQAKPLPQEAANLGIHFQKTIDENGKVELEINVKSFFDSAQLINQFPYAEDYFVENLASVIVREAYGTQYASKLKNWMPKNVSELKSVMQEFQKIPLEERRWPQKSGIPDFAVKHLSDISRLAAENISSEFYESLNQFHFLQWAHSQNLYHPLLIENALKQKPNLVLFNQRIRNTRLFDSKGNPEVILEESLRYHADLVVSLQNKGGLRTAQEYLFLFYLIGADARHLIDLADLANLIQRGARPAQISPDYFKSITKELWPLVENHITNVLQLPLSRSELRNSSSESLVSSSGLRDQLETRNSELETQNRAELRVKKMTELIYSWGSVDDAIANIKDSLKKYRPKIIETYERLEHSQDESAESVIPLSDDEIRALKGEIYKITSSHFIVWGLRTVLSREAAPFFEGSYMNALMILFSKLNLNPLGFQLDWSNKEKAIESIRYVFMKEIPDIIERYENLDHLTLPEIEALRRRIYQITSAHFQAWKLAQVLDRRTNPDFDGSYSKVLSFVFPKLNLNPLGFQLDWTTREKGIESIRYVLAQHRPQILAKYDQINKLSTSEQDILREQIYAITSGHFLTWGLRTAYNAEYVPYFEGNHAKILAAVFPKLQLNPLRFMLDWTTKEKAIESIRDVMSREAPTIIERYDRLSQLKEPEIESLKEDIYKITYGHFKVWGLSSAIHKRISFFKGSYSRALKEVFSDPRLSFDETEMRQYRKKHTIMVFRWKESERIGIENIRYAVKEHRPGLIERYEKLGEMTPEETDQLRQDFYKIQSGHFSLWKITAALSVSSAPYFEGSYIKALMSAFPDLHLNPLGFQFNWDTKEKSIDSIRYAISYEIPAIIERYDRFEELSQGEIETLKQEIYQITAGHLQLWGLGAVGDKRKTPFFSGSYIKALRIVFEKLDLNPLGFRLGWSSEEKTIESIRYVFSQQAPGIIARYQRFDQLTPLEKDALRDEIYNIGNGRLNLWGISGAFSNDVFHGSLTEALIQSFKRLELSPLGFQLDWSTEKKGIESVRFVFRKEIPHIMKQYDGIDQLSPHEIADLREDISRIATGNFKVWGIGAIFTKSVQWYDNFPDFMLQVFDNPKLALRRENFSRAELRQSDRIGTASASHLGDAKSELRMDRKLNRQQIRQNERKKGKKKEQVKMTEDQKKSGITRRRSLRWMIGGVVSLVVGEEIVRRIYSNIRLHEKAVFPVYGVHILDFDDSLQSIERTLDNLLNDNAKDKILFLKEASSHNISLSQAYQFARTLHPDLPQFPSQPLEKLIFEIPDIFAEAFEILDRDMRDGAKARGVGYLRQSAQFGNVSFPDAQSEIILRKGVRFDWERESGSSWVKWIQRDRLFLQSHGALMNHVNFSDFRKIVTQFIVTLGSSVVERDRNFAKQINDILQSDPSQRIVFHRGHHHFWGYQLLPRAAKPIIAVEEVETPPYKVFEAIDRGQSLSDKLIFDHYFWELLENELYHVLPSLLKKPTNLEIETEFKKILKNTDQNGGSVILFKQILEESKMLPLQNSRDLFLRLHKRGIITNKAWGWFDVRSNRSELTSNPPDSTTAPDSSRSGLMSELRAGFDDFFGKDGIIDLESKPQRSKEEVLREDVEYAKNRLSLPNQNDNRTWIRGNGWIRVSATAEDAFRFNQNWKQATDELVQIDFDGRKLTIKTHAMRKAAAWFSGNLEYERTGIFVGRESDDGFQIENFIPQGSYALDAVTSAGGFENPETQQSTRRLGQVFSEDVENALGISDPQYEIQVNPNLIKIDVHSHPSWSRYPDGPSPGDHKVQMPHGIEFVYGIEKDVLSVYGSEGYAKPIARNLRRAELPLSRLGSTTALPSSPLDLTGELPSSSTTPTTAPESPSDKAMSELKHLETFQQNINQISRESLTKAVSRAAPSASHLNRVAERAVGPSSASAEPSARAELRGGYSTDFLTAGSPRSVASKSDIVELEKFLLHIKEKFFDPTGFLRTELEISGNAKSFAQYFPLARPETSVIPGWVIRDRKLNGKKLAELWFETNTKFEEVYVQTAFDWLVSNPRMAADPDRVARVWIELEFFRHVSALIFALQAQLAENIEPDRARKILTELNQFIIEDSRHGSLLLTKIAPSLSELMLIITGIFVVMNVPVDLLPPMMIAENSWPEPLRDDMLTLSVLAQIEHLDHVTFASLGGEFLVSPEERLELYEEFGDEMDFVDLNSKLEHILNLAGQGNSQAQFALVNLLLYAPEFIFLPAEKRGSTLLKRFPFPAEDALVRHKQTILDALKFIDTNHASLKNIAFHEIFTMDLAVHLLHEAHLTGRTSLTIRDVLMRNKKWTAWQKLEPSRKRFLYKSDEVFPLPQLNADLFRYTFKEKEKEFKEYRAKQIQLARRIYDGIRQRSELTSNPPDSTTALKTGDSHQNVQAGPQTDRRSRAELRRVPQTVEKPTPFTDVSEATFELLGWENTIAPEIKDSLVSSANKFNEVFSVLSNSRNDQTISQINSVSTANETDNNQTTIVYGVAPGMLENLPIAYAGTVAMRKSGSVVIFGGTKTQASFLKEHLFGDSDAHYPVNVVNKTNAATVLNGITGNNVKFILYGVKDKDEHFADQLRSELRGKVQFESRIESQDQLSQTFGVAQIAESLRSELRTAWAQLTAA